MLVAASMILGCEPGGDTAHRPSQSAPPVTSSPIEALRRALLPLTAADIDCPSEARPATDPVLALLAALGLAFIEPAQCVAPTP